MIRDALLLSSIMESIDSIEEYLRDGRSFFYSDKNTRDAVLRNLHTLSESELRGATSRGSATWSCMTTCRWISP